MSEKTFLKVVPGSDKPGAGKKDILIYLYFSERGFNSSRSYLSYQLLDPVSVLYKCFQFLKSFYVLGLFYQVDVFCGYHYEPPL